MTQDIDRSDAWLRSPRRLMVWTLAPLLALLVPLIAMQLTAEVDWTLTDFVFMGALLGTAGLAYGLATRRILRVETRLLIAMMVLAAFLLLWADAAVGVFGLLGGS